MRSRGGGGDARLKYFNLTHCGLQEPMMWAPGPSVDSILRWPGRRRGGGETLPNLASMKSVVVSCKQV